MTRWVALVGAATMMLALMPLAGGTAGAADPPGAIPGSYIVVLESGAPGSVAAEHRRDHDAAVTHVYRNALRGYAARMSERAAARIARDPRVAYVDLDRVVTTAHHACGHFVRDVEGPCDEEPAPTGSITGTVTDTGGAVIAGAAVAVDGTSLAATTGDEGIYTIADVPAGEHTVTATADGFDARTEETSVTGGGITTLDFTLTPATTPDGQPVPWGVDRVGAPLATNTGAGVHVYVLDTGIDADHRDLTVSADGYAVETCKGRCTTAWDDDHGHGTHVAGTIGAIDNDVDVVGVAPDVTLHAVKVLAKNGSGTRSGVIAGIDWVATQAAHAGEARVVNMSLSGSGSKTGTCTNGEFTASAAGGDAYHEAICTATGTGVVFAVAAGNGGADASGSVPAAYADTVITVSATTIDSDWPGWSNWGTGTAGSGIPTDSAPVGIAAPGVEIPSTRAGGGTTTMSGTSMAAPHVAGAVALFLAEGSHAGDATAFTNARSDLLETRAQATWDGSSYINGWTNTSDNSHVERFLQVTGL